MAEMKVLNTQANEKKADPAPEPTLTRVQFENKTIEGRNKVIRSWGFDPESQADADAIAEKVAALP